MSKAAGQTKTFIVDTNVLLHDPESIFSFGDNDVGIPITVLEELDKFKKGNLDINYHAREIIRLIDQKQVEGKGEMNKGGVRIREGLGKIRILFACSIHPDLVERFSIFPAEKPDNQILNIAYTLHKNNPGKKIILVTKDINLRTKARLVMEAEDYTTDMVDNSYTGKMIIEGVQPNLFDKLHDVEGNLDLAEILPYFKDGEKVFPNQFVILKNGSSSALTRYDEASKALFRITNPMSAGGRVSGIQSRNLEQRLALEVLLDPALPLVTITGKAGTGKTLLAMAAALESKKSYSQIYISRPTVPLSNKDIGYLPGDIKSKLQPYMQPLYDALKCIKVAVGEKEAKVIDENLFREKIEINPLAYIRGRSLPRIFFIIDEAQNLTPHEVKTIITRAGEGTKIVFTGDIYQIDHPYLDEKSNGLSNLVEKMKVSPLSAHINLEQGERSDLANEAIKLL